MRNLLWLLLANVNGLVALTGFVWLYVGLAGWWPPAANITAGLLLLAAGVSPYLAKRAN